MPVTSIPSWRRPTALALAVSAALPLTVRGQPAAAPAGAPLPVIVVTPTRSPADAAQVPATVTQIDRSRIERGQPHDEADLLHDEPDVTVAHDARRFGATRVNIRGIEDNRVLQLVDGVRLPDWYSGGGPTNYTVQAALGPMPDFLRRVEVLRGPASSLYGSEALGGVIGYLTVDPADLLVGAAVRGARVKLGHDGASDANMATALGAMRHGPLSVLVGLSVREGHETDNRGRLDIVGPGRTRPHPQTVSDRGWLLKGVLAPDPEQRWIATFEGRRQDTDTQVLRWPASLPRLARMEGDDRSQRGRASLEWEHLPAQGAYELLSIKAFRQETHTRNGNGQVRSGTSATCSATASGPNRCRIDQAFSMEQTLTGLGVQLHRPGTIGRIRHRWTAGAEVTRLAVEERRDAVIVNETTGARLSSLAGETFPARDFAPGHTDTWGLYLQDEVTGLADGRLTLTPGLRYDRTRLVPKPDALFQQVLAGLGRDVATRRFGAWSPKLGATWALADGWSLYGQAARGFRAPNYAEAHGAFRNGTQFYATVPNPHLKPETSVGLELGARYAEPSLSVQVAVFDNRYKNFIEQVALACPNDPRCYAPTPAWRTYLAENLKRVSIRGAEARGRWVFAPGWRLDGAVAHARGTDRTSGRPLNSVEPMRASFALTREAAWWGAEARLRVARAKDRIDESAAPYFHPPGYGVVDLAGWWRLGGPLRLTAGVRNLLDKKYWLWSDIRQADNSTVGTDFYSRPGRSLHIALQVDL